MSQGQCESAATLECSLVMGPASSSWCVAGVLLATLMTTLKYG